MRRRPRGAEPAEPPATLGRTREFSRKQWLAPGPNISHTGRARRPLGAAIGIIDSILRYWGAQRTARPAYRLLPAWACREILGLGAGAASVLLLGVSGAWGQEAVRMSLASEQAAEQRQAAASTLNYYNLQLGPTAWNFAAGLSLSADDNIRLTDAHTESDLTFGPHLDTHMVWRMSDKNSINLAFGGGYLAYLQHSEFDRPYISPDSQVSFDLYVGNWWFNLHDQFSIYENAYSDPTVTGIADYQRLENDAGVSGVWDLNKALVKLGYDHVNYADLTSSFGSPDVESEVFSGSAGYVLRQNNYAGVEFGSELLNYSPANYIKSGVQWNMGAYYDGQLTQYIRARGSVGYTIFSPETVGNLPTPSDLTGLYAQVALTHRLNQYVSYSLTGGRNLTFSYYGGTVEDYYLNFSANWNLIYKMTLSTSLGFDHGTQKFSYVSGGRLGVRTENFDRYAPGVSLGRNLTQKLSAALQYRYFLRDSDLGPSGRYAANIVTLDLRYRF